MSSECLAQAPERAVPRWHHAALAAKAGFASCPLSPMSPCQGATARSHVHHVVVLEAGRCSPALDVCVLPGFPSCGERGGRSLQGSVLQSPSSESHSN